MTERLSSGDEYLRRLAALASSHRLRIVAALARQPGYVSQLARDIGISRPLLQMHLRKLQAAGLVKSRLEVSDDGKALKYYDLEPFAFRVDAETIREAADTLKSDAD